MFAPGQTWNDVLGTDNITAVSSAYDLSGLHVAADGTVTVVAVPVAVPEPSTWAMLVLGLLAIGSMARRRAPSRPR